MQEDMTNKQKIGCVVPEMSGVYFGLYWSFF